MTCVLVLVLAITLVQVIKRSFLLKVTGGKIVVFVSALISHSHPISLDHDH